MKTYKFFLTVLFATIIAGSAFADYYKTNATVSFYADDFHGKKTSSGETFNMYDYTCANKTLPFGTILKLTNPDNGKTINVRVNDRGPFVPERELDLSKAAASALGFIKDGTAKVNIEIVQIAAETKISQQTAEKAITIMKERFPEWNPDVQANTVSVAEKTPAATTAAKKIYEAGKVWDIQLGSFKNMEYANELAQKLLKDGFSNVVYQKTDDITRVIIRKTPSEEMPALEAKLREKGYTDFFARERK